MKISTFVLLLLLAILPFASVAAEETDVTASPLKCDRGPAPKTYGKLPWLVYSCTDEQTLMIVAALDNPAGPFYFKFEPRADGYHLSGEGTGLRDAARDAFNDLKVLTKQDIADLIEATKGVNATVSKQGPHAEDKSDKKP